MNHVDFELGIRADVAGDYAVTVQSAHTGESNGRFRLPFDSAGLTDRLQRLEIALLSNLPGHRRVLSTSEEVVREFGQSMFEALFSGDVRAAYDVARHEAGRQAASLRVKLRLGVPSLAALPWEYLYDARRGEYLCLSRSTPVVRYLEIPDALRPLAVSGPLRILGVVASPSDLAPLDVAKERQQLASALQGLSERGAVHLDWLERPTWRDLQRRLRTHPYHLFHFIGHGGFDERNAEGLIVLTNDRGEADRIQAVNLGRLLGDHFSLRLAVLNACEGARGNAADLFTSAAATLVRRGTPAVLAMQYQITDQGAIEIGRAFYEAIADGLPVDMAVTEARKAVCLAIPDTLEWGIPVLYTHAPDGVLFELGVVSTEAELPQPQSELTPESEPQLEEPLPEQAPQPEPEQPPRSEPDSQLSQPQTEAWQAAPTPARPREPQLRMHRELSAAGPGVNERSPGVYRTPVRLGRLAVAVVAAAMIVGVAAFVLWPRSSTLRLAGYDVTIHRSSGVAMTISRHELKASLPVSAPDPHAEVHLVCRPEGDFDIEVSYVLHEWAPGNEGRVGIGAGAVIERASQKDRREYYAFDPGLTSSHRITTTLPTSDEHGTLKLVRRGNQFTGFALINGTWDQVGTTVLAAVPFEIVIQLWGVSSLDPRSASLTNLVVQSSNCHPHR
jgi:hypothetical protein